jgi:uncharacterized membrane protein
MIEDHAPPLSPAGAAAGPSDPVTRTLARLNAWLGVHWLALVTLATGLFIALPLAAPVLAMTGHTMPSAVIYSTYRITCHQLPQRSWYIGGPQAAYSWDEVAAYTRQPEASPLLAFHNPLGNAALGYQVGFCQRDTAIYLSVFMTCLAYGAIRRRRAIGPMPFRLYLLFALPMAIDGFTQLVGLRESTPLLRTLTGGLFGMGSAWLVLSYIDASFRESAAWVARSDPAA